MFTEITASDGTITNIVTQEYEVGTYIIVNNNAQLQGGTTLKEIPYHIKLRKKALKRGDKITKGSYIKGKFKQDINPPDSGLIEKGGLL